MLISAVWLAGCSGRVKKIEETFERLADEFTEEPEAEEPEEIVEEEPEPVEKDAYFDDFLYSFASDQSFRLRRTILPLPGYKYDESLRLDENEWSENNLFDEENLEDLPEDYDENFNDLYSIINKMNFGSVLVCVEGLFTPEGRTYKKYKDKFDKFYDKTYSKKGNSFANSNAKPNKRIEGLSVTSNAKTESSSSKKNVINAKYNDLNIVKDLNVY